jgi:hypothetical protein
MCNEIENKPGHWPPRGGRAGALLKRAAPPALVYLGVALGLPALNGASLKYGAEFWKHAAATCVTLVILVAVLLALEMAWEKALTRFQRER